MIPAARRLSTVAREEGWQIDPIHGMANKRTRHQ
jgi:hypothetical protein